MTEKSSTGMTEKSSTGMTVKSSMGMTQKSSVGMTALSRYGNVSGKIIRLSSVNSTGLGNFYDKQKSVFYRHSCSLPCQNFVTRRINIFR